MACLAPFAKIFLFRPEANQFTDSRRPVPREGRAHVTNAGRDAVDAGSALDETCCSGRRSRVVLTPRCWRQVCDKKRRRRCQTSLVTGESTKETVKTITRGMPGETGVTVVTMLVCFILFRTRGYGCIGHPAFPAPSDSREAKRFMHHSGASRRENAEARRHCEDRSDEA